MVDRLRSHMLTALGGLRSSRMLLIAAVLILAAAIGMNLAVFGLVDRALLSPARHLADPAALFGVGLEFDDPDGRPQRMTTTSYVTFRSLRDDVPAIAAAAAWQRGPTSLVIDGEQRAAETRLVSATYFELLGVSPRIGAGFRPDEAGVVVSHGFWMAAFGGDPRVLGRRVMLSGRDYQVTGVMPRGFSGHVPIDVDAWFPIEQAMAGEPGWDTNPFRRIVSIVVRMTPGGAAAAAAQASAVTGRRIVFTPLGDEVVAPRERRIAWWLAGVSVLVLLIGLANAATLLMVRAARRRRELAIRSALGATAARLVGHAAAEALAVALAAVAVSLLLSRWLDEVVRAVLLTGIIEQGGVDRTTVSAALPCGAVAAFAAWAASIVHLPRGGRFDDLKASHGSRRILQKGLLLTQTALSVLLLAGAGMFGRSLYALLNQDLGMSIESVLVADFEEGGGPRAVDDGVFTRALDRIRALPGVVAATGFRSMPFGPFHVPPISIPGRSEPPSVDGQLPFLIAATPEFMEILDIRITDGRPFSDGDRRGAPVVIVNETMAREVWAGERAVGKCIRIGFDPDFDPSLDSGPHRPTSVPCREVIGVARDVRQRSIVPSGIEARLMQYYVPPSQVPTPPQAPAAADDEIWGLLIRTRGDTEALAEPIRKLLVEGRADLPFARVRPFSQLFERQIRPWRMGLTLLALFSALALTIAGGGLYAAFAHAVAMRRREMAIRIAIGASPSSVRGLVLREAALLAAVAGILGGTVAVLAGRSLEAVLFGLVAGDPTIISAAVALMILMALAATLVPALSASRSDPTSLLRAE